MTIGCERERMEPPKDTGAISMQDTLKTPEYTKAVIEQWPDPNDASEQQIVASIRNEFLASDWGRQAYERIGNLEIDHLRDSLSHLGDKEHIYASTQKVLKDISEAGQSHIVSGKANLQVLEKGKPVLLLTNHLGSYKLVSLLPDQQKEAGLGDPMVRVYYPFPGYFAAMHPVAEELGNDLFEASFEYPGQVGEIYRASDSIEVPPPLQAENGTQSKSRTEILTDATRVLIEKHPNAVITSFPEGGTSGKRNGRGPYGLEPYRTGSFVIASKLGIPILPVAQYFNPKSGFELAVFEPVRLSPDATPEQYTQAAQAMQVKTQDWLNSRKAV
ncbi:MAG: hypothetical protein AAB531_01810 [Patescibacteria group bacterium]